MAFLKPVVRDGLQERQVEESGSFLKKRTKKLLIPLGYRGPTGTAPAESKKFLRSFF